MENKGYADFGGQTRCIMGNVEMANRTFLLEHFVMILRRFDPFFVLFIKKGTCKHEYVYMYTFYEQDKGSNLLSIIT